MKLRLYGAQVLHHLFCFGIHPMNNDTVPHNPA